MNYLNIDEAAAYINVHRETIRKYVKQKKLVAYKGEKIIRFKTEDLDKLMTKI